MLARLLRWMERLSGSSVTVNYSFDSTAEAAAAVEALRREDIPATVTTTGMGPVVLLDARYRERAERRVPALVNRV